MCCLAVRFFPPGDVFCFDVLHCSKMNGHMESRRRGWRGPLDMLKDTCGALGGLRMMDRVPLQVAVISLSHGEGQRGWILCGCVCGLSVCVHVVCFCLCRGFEKKLQSICVRFSFPYHELK